MNNYSAASVTLTSARPHSNADRLLVWNILGTPVITDLSYSPGDYVVFIPAEAEINPRIISVLNLYRHTEKNADPSLKAGYIEDSGRVRTVRLRGEYSAGLVIRMDPFMEAVRKIAPEAQPPTGEFINIGDLWITRKYVSKRTYNTKSTNEPARGKRTSRLIKNQFRFHEDTAQLGRNLFKFGKDTPVHVTEKYHGSSAIYSRLLTKRKLSLLERLARFLGVRVQESEYGFVYGSRRVIKNEFDDNSNKQHYYKTDLWAEAAQKLDIENKLEDGITLYGELVGYVPSTGSPIQRFGKYAYHYLSGRSEVKFIVYRITQTSNSGRVYEFTPEQIKSYCTQHALAYPVTHFIGKFGEFHQSSDDDIISAIRKTPMASGPCPWNDPAPREGIVIRRLDVPYWEAYKVKSLEFLEQETKANDNNETNIEDDSDNEHEFQQ